MWTVLLASLGVLPSVSPHCFPKPSLDENYLEVVNSPVLTNMALKELRVIWRIRDWSEGDRVTLYRDGGEGPQEVFSLSVEKSTGFVDTKLVQYSDSVYSVEYRHDNNSLVSSGDTRLQSDWMWCLGEEVQELLLDQLFLPGSHNAAAYLRPTLLSTLGPFGYFNNYVYTQDETVEGQLRRGSRYLDLRVGYYPGDRSQAWWANHDFVRLRPLADVLAQVVTFINSSRDPVILDFHNFPVGFKENPAAHNLLSEYLKEELKEWLYPPPEAAWKTSLGAVLASPRRLIVSYNKPEVAASHGFFPPVAHLWANAQRPEQLYSFLHTRLTKSWRESIQMRAAMAELSPTAQSVITGFRRGLRAMADEVNVNVSLGLADPCWGNRVQVVAVDFLSSTSLVNDAVRNNLRRANSLRGTDSGYDLPYCHPTYFIHSTQE